MESHSDSYYYGAGKNLCAGISIRNMNRQIYRRSKAEEGHTYVENINNTGSWRQRVSIADGYWARGNESLDVWNDEDVQHYSDSHFIKEFTNYVIYLQFIKKNPRTTNGSITRNNSPNLYGKIYTLMGVIHTDTNPSKYSDLHDKRYYISYDELAENWKENFKAKCDGTWAVADKQNKCPPSEDIGTIDTDIYTWTFNFGSAPKPTGITFLNYPDNDYVEPNNVGQHWKIRIFLYMKLYK